MDERVEAAAVREVQEETGLADVKLEALIATTYHTYTQQGRVILKRTFWYSMRSSSSHVLTPQLTEDISTVEWVCRNNLPEYLKNTYGNIRDVLGTLNIPVVP
jgi:NUDIX domain.